MSAENVSRLARRKKWPAQGIPWPASSMNCLL